MFPTIFRRSSRSIKASPKLSRRLAARREKLTNNQLPHRPRRLANIILVLCLLSSSVPAAPQIMMAEAKESIVTFNFWFQSSGLAKLFQGFNRGNAKGQEKQADRDARIARLEIFPGSVTIDLGEHLRFAAVAYDEDNNPVGGVKIKWSGRSSTPGRRVRLTPHGEFEGTSAGSFTITAEAGKTLSQVTVEVRQGVLPNKNSPPTGTRQVSTRDNPESQIGAIKTLKRTENSAQIAASITNRRNTGTSAQRAHARTGTKAPATGAVPFFLPADWGDGNYWSADDPGNSVGNPPGAPLDGGAGSGNFQFSAPILTLTGRGIDLSLAASYNSRLWNKANSQIGYDNDRGWPAPGFSLGLGKMLGMGVYNGCMLVDADGSRHGYTGTITFYSWGTYGVMHTTDGSLIDYTYWTGTGGIITWAQARLPNGVVINYGANGPGGVFPTSIEDANGNFITITYVNNSGPRIQTISDTLNRTINFYYDYNNLLTAITGPTLSGGTRTLVRFHYHQLALNPGFNGLTVGMRDSYPWVVDAIYYPATSTGYWFNDSDSYSSYGMLAKVVEERAMGFSASSLNDMGSVWQGSITRVQTHNYPLSPDYSLTDAPTYTSMTESWTRDGTNFDSATTGYAVNEIASPRLVTITMPNGTKTTQKSYNHPGQYDDGIMFYDETVDANNNLLYSSSSTFEPGAYGSVRPTRVERTDERGQLTATQFIYGSVYNQVAEVREYDYGGTTLLRSTRMTYQNSTNYTYRHIFNLPLSVEVYAGDNVTRVSRTDYQYDGQTLSATPNVVQHDQAYNPYADAEGFCYWDYDWNDPDCTGSCWDYGCDGYCPQYYVCPYDYSTEYRGNITQVTTYADAAGPTGALTETRRYDTTGNMVKASTSCCEETSFNYTIDTQYAYPLAKTSGSATDPYAQVTTSATFDFYTAANLSTTDTNGRQSTGTYDTNSLRTTSKVAPTGAHTDFAYDDAALSVTQTSYLAASEGGGIVAQNVKYFNGRKEVWREKALGAGGVWDFVDTTFNNMGQMSQRTRPFRSGDTLQWTVTTYDALGRPRTVTSPDGSMTETFYNEATRPSVASSSPGQTTRVRDPWGRERWARADSSGRIVEVVEPDPSGDGTVSSNGMVTTYGYNTLGKPTSVTQGAQTRTFKYDAVGRLIAQKLAEKNATLNDAGMYVGAGTWSDVFTYDNRSNLTSKTDARGVKTVYNYNSDPLNRLQSVSWDTSGFGDSTNPIVPAGTVTYQYRQKDTPSQLRDVTQIEVISTAAVSVTGYNTSGNSETYVYDTEGRVLRKTLKFNNRLSYPFETDFAYDSLDRAKNVTYPAGYSNGSARKVVHHDYDVASRLSGLTYDGQTHVSNIVYNAASDTNSLSVGTGTNQVNESYSFNGQTGFLESQAAVRNGTTLLNLSYDYVGANGKRTGQLTKISNNLDHNKDRGYEYDALGRLRRATGGQSVNWAQRYEYDRYGNRHNAYSFTAEQYVRNFYQYGLNRQPNSTELQNWLSTLQSAYAQGPSQFLAAMQSLGVSIFSSQEYANRNRSDHDFVYDLYKTYLYREPDASGWAFWESQVQPNGRSNIRLAFDVCPEFSIKVSAISPYSPPGGATVPPDGIQGIFFDSATNRIGNSGWNYDAAGNQTRTQNSAGVWQRFQYDAANRLVKVKADDNVTVLATYAYGATNERLLTEEGGSRTYYDFEGGATIAEYVESGGSTTPSWSKSYVYLGTRLLSTLTPTGGGGEAVQFHHADRLGTRIVSNPANGTSFEQTTLPFGTALSNESTGATNRRFTSYDRNLTTGLDYAYNRHYDPQQGRFTQVDPAEMNAVSVASPQTLNLYSYCVNDPVNHTDPTGLGFFSFLKKAFKWIAKHWKVIVIAAVIVAAIILIPGAQGLISSVFQHAGKFLVSGLGAAAEEGAGHGIVFKLIFGGAIAGAIAGLGTLLQQKKQNMFEKSEDQAFDRLERLLKKGGACAEFLGPHGLDALKAMKNAPRTTRSTGPINNPTGISMAVPALTGNFRTPTSVTFFTNGPFFIGVNKPALGTFPAGSNGAQLVALMHELAHLVKNPNGTGPLIPDDGGNASQSQTNTDTMLNYRGKNGKTCKEEIFDAK